MLYFIIKLEIVTIIRIYAKDKDTVQKSINYVLSLDIICRPRLDRKREVEVIHHNKKRGYEKRCMMILSIAKYFGYNNELRTKKQKKIMAQTSTRLVYYYYMIS